MGRYPHPLKSPIHKCWECWNGDLGSQISPHRCISLALNRNYIDVSTKPGQGRQQTQVNLLIRVKSKTIISCIPRCPGVKITLNSCSRRQQKLIIQDRPRTKSDQLSSAGSCQGRPRQAIKPDRS